MKKVILAGLFICIILLSAGCKATTPVNSAKLGQEFQLAFGQTVSFSDADLKITFKELIEDSRCPSDVVCIWAGRASCLMEITIGKETNQTVFTQPGLSEEYVITQYGKYNLQFRIEPYPQSGSDIKNSDYRLRLTVTEIP